MSALPHQELLDFHPMTILRDWGNGEHFTVSDANTGVICFGATGSGKTSGPAQHLAHGYLAADFGGLILCAKKEERAQWEKWAAATGRSEDLIIIDKAATRRFNFLDWEMQRPGEGGGLTINIVNMLDVVAGAMVQGGGKGDGGGENKFFDDALHHMDTNLVDLPLFANIPLTLPLMRSIVNSAPLSQEEAQSDKWRNGEGDCATILRAADMLTARSGDADMRADFEECRSYWRQEWPGLHDKTRGIVQLCFAMLARPFLTRPLRQLFSADTNITPEAAFDGKLLLIDLPVQEFRLAGRVASLVWKYCMQVAIMRRKQPASGHLRPVFIWADECQNFVTPFDAEYQAVARSAGGCTVYLTQTRESLRRVLGDSDTTDALLANLQAKFFCQNTGETNEWASKWVIGERWVDIAGKSIGWQEGGNPSMTASMSEQRRRYVDEAEFAVLKRGGPKHNFKVECIVYNGGALFAAPRPQAQRETFYQPFKRLIIAQPQERKG